MTWCSFGAGGAIIATAVIALSLGNRRSAGLWPKKIVCKSLTGNLWVRLRPLCGGDAKTPTP